MNEAFKQAVFWRGIGLLPKLRELHRQSVDPDVWRLYKDMADGPMAKEVIANFGANTPPTKLHWVCLEADAHNLVNPLHLAPFANTEMFVIESLDSGRKLTGCQVIAIMVYGLFVIQGENQEMCGSLCETWNCDQGALLANAGGESQGGISG